MKQFKQLGCLMIVLLTMLMIPFSNMNTTKVQAASFLYQTSEFNIDTLPTLEGKENGEVQHAGYLPNENGDKYPFEKQFLQTFTALQSKEKVTMYLAVEIDNATVLQYVKDVAAYLNTTPGFHRLELIAGKVGEGDVIHPDLTIKVAYTKNQECGTEEGVLGCADGESIYLDQKSTEEQMAENNPYEIQRTLQHELFHVLGFNHTHIFQNNVINKNNQFLSIFEYQEHGQLSEDQYYKQEAPGHSEWKLEHFASDYSVWAQYNNYYEFVRDDSGQVNKVILYHLNNDGTIYSASVYDYTKQAYTETLMFEAQTKYDMKQKSHQKAFKEKVAYKPFRVLETMNKQAPKQAPVQATTAQNKEDAEGDLLLYAGLAIFIILTVMLIMYRRKRKAKVM